MKSKRMNILVSLLLILFIIILYFIRLKYPVISIDTEAFINTPIDIINSWYSIGRFSLGFYIKTLGLIPLNITLNNILSLLFYIISVFILVKDLQKNDIDIRKKIVMFLIILTSPLLAEQYAFTLQNFEVSLSYFLLIIVMATIKRVIYYKKYIYLFFTPLLILVFGTYQSFYLMYITLAIIYYLEYFDENLNFWKQVKIISIYVAIFVVYIILTIVVGNLVNNFLGVASTGYLTEQMNWINGNFLKGILYCGYYIVEVLFGIGVNNHLGFSILFFLVIMYFRDKGKDKNLFYKLAVLLLFISPFFISILFGTITFNRAQFSIPIIMAYLYGKFLKDRKVMIIIGCIIFIQSISTFYLFYIDLVRYNNDIELVQYVQAIDNDKNLPFIFIGNVNYENKFVGEVLGKSFYNWDYKTDRLSNDRINGLMKAKGFEYKVPSLEQIREAFNDKDNNLELVNYHDSYIVINLDRYNSNS